MKTNMGTRRLSPLIFNVGTTRSGRLWTSARDSPQCALNRRLDVPQRRSGDYAEEENLLLMPGFEPRGQPDLSLVPTPYSTSV
jgi:hypothetical protein